MRTYKILVADDSNIEAERIRRSLESLPGAEVTVVEDGTGAVRASKSTRFDLVLCDFEMPGLNGLQVVRFLRSTWSRLELPILMLTVRDDVQTKVLSLRQGANDYVTKPVEPEELLARVQAQLDLKVAVEENIKARMQILEARKLETIGRLAAGLAHELNTPAQFAADNLVFLEKVFNGSSELLARTRDEVAALSPEEHPWAREFLDFWRDKHLSYLLGEAPKALQESLSGVLRMSRIVKELKEFAGLSEKPWGLSDLNRALENTIAVSRQLWSSVAEVSFDLDPALPQISCDVAALKQAFFHILISAVEGTAASASNPPRAIIRLVIKSVRSEAGVEIRFHTANCGLTISPQMFDALAATEPTGVGLGHGLAVAHSVVVGQHRGQLSCESPVGLGTTFLVRLPEGLSGTVSRLTEAALAR